MTPGNARRDIVFLLADKGMEQVIAGFLGREKFAGSAPSWGSRGMSAPKLTTAAFRAPDRSYETPDEPVPDVIDPSLDDLTDEPVADESAPAPVPATGSPAPSAVEPKTEAEPDPEPAAAEPVAGGPVPDVFLGTTRPSPQYGSSDGTPRSTGRSRST